MPEKDRLYQELDSYVEGSRSQFESRLAELVEVPTISMDPDRKGDCRRGAELAREYLEAIGAEAELIETPGNPVVIGRIAAGANDPTLTIYNHIDVQPADPSEWHKAPFTFFKHDGRYEGRGTTDDKGPALSAMFAAGYAAKHDLPLNMNFVWELEAEIGCPNLQDTMRGHNE